MMRGKCSGLTAWAWVVLMPAMAVADYSGGVYFGDSLTDTGNIYLFTNNTVPESPPHYDGRFSDGPIWAEYVAEAANLGPVVPILGGGTNVAFGSAESGFGSGEFNLPNVGRQIEEYLNITSIAPDELITLWAGANDFLNGGQTDASIPTSNIAAHITTLAGAGGQTFIVPNLPPLGQVPLYRETPLEPLLDQLSLDFNTMLHDHIVQLESSLNVTIFEVDTYGLTQSILADPAAYGFTNVTNRAYDELTGIVVPNPEEYLFWDDYHPTGAAHAIFGGLAASFVPEPTSCVFLALGSGLLLWRRR